MIEERSTEDLEAEGEFIARRKALAQQEIGAPQQEMGTSQDAWAQQEFAKARRSLHMWGWAFLITFIMSAIGIVWLVIKIGEWL